MYEKQVIPQFSQTLELLKYLLMTLTYPFHASVQFSSVTQSCLIICDPMSCSTPGLPIYHQLPEFTQTHVH